jgi:hypothetical protein
MKAPGFAAMCASTVFLISIPSVAAAEQKPAPTPVQERWRACSSRCQHYSFQYSPEWQRCVQYCMKNYLQDSR